MRPGASAAENIERREARPAAAAPFGDLKSDARLDDGLLVAELGIGVDLQLAFDGGLEVGQPGEGIARCASIDVVI
jgi:hypothetical protein